MSNKGFEVIEKAVLTAPLLLTLAEFDTDIDELLEAQRAVAKNAPENLIPTIKFIYENGFIRHKYLYSIFRNNSITQDGLFFLLLLFIGGHREKIHDDDAKAYELGARHQHFDPFKFDYFLVENIDDYAIQVAKNILASKSVLKDLVLRKGNDCIALEAAIANPNMDAAVLELLAESFYLAHRDSTIQSLDQLKNNGNDILLNILFLQDDFACACVHTQLIRKVKDTAERLMNSYDVRFED